MKHALLLVPLLLSGCASVPAAGAGQCDAAPLARFVGAIATADFSRVALKRSHARTIRWIRPGNAVTMDYLLDRLNVRLDDKNFITALDCS